MAKRFQLNGQHSQLGAEYHGSTAEANVEAACKQISRLFSDIFAHLEFGRSIELNVCSNMNVLVKHSQIERYLNGKNQWRGRTEIARHFATGIEALRYCSQNGLKGVEIVYEFENPNYTFNVVLSEEEVEPEDRLEQKPKIAKNHARRPKHSAAREVESRSEPQGHR